MKKFLEKIIFLYVMLVILCNIKFEYINASLGEGFNTDIYNQVTTEQNTEIDNALFRISGTVILILQILAIAGVVITGVRYMYAGAEDKGKIKQTLIWVIIGAIFVFSASAVINFVTNSGNNIF